MGKFIVECNYLQSMEADYDPTHFAFLHSTLGDSAFTSRPPLMNSNNGVAGGVGARPNVLGDVSGQRVGRAVRGSHRIPDSSFSAGVGAPWMMPIFCAGAIGGTDLHSANIRIPIDNASFTFFKLRWSYEPLPENEVVEYRGGNLYYPELIPGTFTPRHNRANDYGIDREAQKHLSFSGITGYPTQDMAMAENQRGPIADRTKEHLTSSDRHVIHVRRRLIQAAKAMASGIEPTEPWHPEAYRYHYESAVAPSHDEAIAQATARATATRLTQSRII